MSDCPYFASVVCLVASFVLAVWAFWMFEKSKARVKEAGRLLAKLRAVKKGNDDDAG